MRNKPRQKQSERENELPSSIVNIRIMAKNKVYIVLIDIGSYDSWIRKVDKVFKDKDAANNYAISMNEKRNALKAKIPLYDDEDYTEKEQKEINTLCKNNNLTYSEIVEFNEYTVEEFTLE